MVPAWLHVRSGSPRCCSAVDESDGGGQAPARPPIWRLPIRGQTVRSRGNDRTHALSIEMTDARSMHHVSRVYELFSVLTLPRLEVRSFIRFDSIDTDSKFLDFFELEKN